MGSTGGRIESAISVRYHRRRPRLPRSSRSSLARLKTRRRYGDKFASKNLRKYFKKVKNAQEAHEAIRLTNIRRLPSSLIGILDDDALKLYTLIWTRTMACQMEPLLIDTMTRKNYTPDIYIKVPHLAQNMRAG